MAVLRLITSSYLVGACTGMSFGLFASEDAIDVACRLSELVNYIDTVGDQAAADYRRSSPVHSGHTGEAVMAGSRMTAACVTRGAISLSNSSHFPLRPYSNAVNPVALPPG